MKGCYVCGECITRENAAVEKPVEKLPACRILTGPLFSLFRCVLSVILRSWFEFPNTGPDSSVYLPEAVIFHFSEKGATILIR
jgi:hypothetical protein